MLTLTGVGSGPTLMLQPFPARSVKLPKSLLFCSFLIWSILHRSHSPVPTLDGIQDSPGFARLPTRLIARCLIRPSPDCRGTQVILA